MKELSIEEKARRYDEAIEKAKYYYGEGKTLEYASDITSYIFPELKESEDERIKKSLLDYLHTLPNHFSHNGSLVIDWIAWLEKQGNNMNCIYDKELSELLHIVIRWFINDPNISYSDREKVSIKVLPYVELLEKQGEGIDYVNKEYWRGYREGKQEILDKYAELEKQCKNNMGISESVKQKLEDNLSKALEKETPESWNEFLDEKKPYGQRQECSNCQMNYAGECKGSCVMKRSEQRLAEKYNITGIGSKHAQGKLGEMLKNQDNNVEPKFKVGDWIVYNRDDCSKEIIQVHDIRDGRYYFTDNVHFSWSVKECDEKCHLWKIQDAKPGDVLCCENGWTCIFKVLNSDISFSSYCFMDNTRWFCETGSESHTLDKAFIKAYYGKIYPATEEQRDLLFQKMHESGYEWDADKKELKKMEQKPAWSKEDEAYRYWILELLKTGELKTPKLADRFKAASNWVESIKDRVEPQKKWSEEDEESILEICNYLDRLVHEDEDNQATRLTVQELKNWLKSLRPRNTWKPSEEQMNFLKELVEDNNQRHFYTILRSLYEQLKKLREESI